MAQFNCFKCGGSGTVAFHHIENGVCFACGGSGKLAYRPKQGWTDPHPELLVSDADLSSTRQWGYLDHMCGGNSDTACRFLKAAGAQIASQRYVSRGIMSKAIGLAKAATQCVA